MQQTGPVEVRFLTSGGNLLKVGSILALGLTNYHEPLGPGAEVSLHATHTGRSGVSGIEQVDAGRYHFSIASPPWFVRSAAEDRGEFGWPRRPLNLAAVCTFPHHDKLALAVRKDLGIKSLHDIREQKPPLRISSGPLHFDHPLGWVLDVLFAEYGFSVEDIRRWGGSIGADDRQLNVLAEGPKDRKDRVVELQEGRLDGIFDEGIMSKTWKDAADTVDLEFLRIDDDVLARLDEKYGVRRTVLPAGRLRGVDHDIPTVDFADWLLYCQADLPEKLVYLTLVAIEEQKTQLEAMFLPMVPYQGISELPIPIENMWRGTELPLHPGAERFFRERGYLA